jgi:hypothetical protein
LHAALSRFFDSGLRLRPHGVRLADRAVARAVRTIVSKTCRRAAIFVDEYGDTSPPPLTPLTIARAVAQAFGSRYGHIVMRAPGAIFGVASRRGLVFENHNLHGSMSIWVGVVCQ